MGIPKKGCLSFGSGGWVFGRILKVGSTGWGSESQSVRIRMKVTLHIKNTVERNKWQRYTNMVFNLAKLHP